MKWKNLASKVTGISILSIFLMSATVFAYTAESPKSTKTLFGYTYDAYSRAHVEPWTSTSDHVFASTLILTQNSDFVPVGYMGAQARLYSITGVLKDSSTVKYNSSSSNNLVVFTPLRLLTSDTYYSQGRAEFYNGNSYEGLSINMSPRVTLSNTKSLSVTNPLPDNLKQQEEYAVNNNGETFGSALLEAKIGEEPDLISALGTNGIQGYVKADDLFPDVSDPQEALRSYSVSAIIPLYDTDGITVIGEFEMKTEESIPVSN
ncbi:hypothetical protein [Paenibacillus harenae]|uniref:hypothetical protein n=1 Tax=Paenibacillus harenae TaxID=306543 RepID=UPI0004215914|nr:hypothetical protein [Paenibacillus harenae]